MVVMFHLSFIGPFAGFFSLLCFSQRKREKEKKPHVVVVEVIPLGTHRQDGSISIVFFSYGIRNSDKK